jgi:CRP/FNR family cyclic AMP-dependent transcriptional regulator
MTSGVFSPSALMNEIASQSIPGEGSALIQKKASKSIIEQGEEGNVMFFIGSGKANIVVNGQVFETVKPGGIIGEMALTDAEVRSADVVAATDYNLIPISRQRFVNLVQKNPCFHYM